MHEVSKSITETWLDLSGGLTHPESQEGIFEQCMRVDGSLEMPRPGEKKQLLVSPPSGPERAQAAGAM